MSYYKVTVEKYDEKADNKYDHEDVYEQRVDEVDLWSIISAVNKINQTQRISIGGAPIMPYNGGGGTTLAAAHQADNTAEEESKNKKDA